MAALLPTNGATAPLRAIEGFAGGGSVHLATTEAGFTTVFANDWCPQKRETYAANFPTVPLDGRSISDIHGHELPLADLLGLTSPCTDYSINGLRQGNDGTRSVLAHQGARLVHELAALGRAPKVVVYENVPGLLSVNAGQDYAALCQAMVSAGYRVGVVVINALRFLPQSRERLFLVCVRADLALPDGLAAARPTRGWHPARLVKAHQHLSPEVHRAWVWWKLPKPAPRTTTLADVLEEDGPNMRWRSDAWVERMLALLKPLHRERLEKARAAGLRVGVVKQRLRGKGKDQARWCEVHLEGYAHCLLTSEGHEMQRLVILDDMAPHGVRVRDFTPRERARLTGLPEDYILPGIVRSRELTGDAVVVPVYAHLAQHLLRPLAEAEPRSRPLVPEEGGAVVPPLPVLPNRRRRVVDGSGRLVSARPGIKGRTLPVSLYLMPDAHRRVMAKARAAGVGLQEYLMRLADRDCAAAGEPPLPRYAPAPRRMPARSRPGRGGGRRAQVEGISALHRQNRRTRPRSRDASPRAKHPRQPEQRDHLGTFHASCLRCATSAARDGWQPTWRGGRRAAARWSSRSRAVRVLRSAA